MKRANDLLTSNIVTTPRGSATVTVMLAGELDLANADQLRDDLIALINDQHPRHIDLDLTGLTFCDCSGLRCFIQAGAAARRRRCRIRIVGARGIAATVLSMTGVGAQFGLSSPAAGQHPL